MEISKNLIGQIAGIISFISFIIYIIAILKGTTKPSRSTWWILTFVGIMIALAYYASGGREAIWISLSYIIGPLLIAILSLKYGEGRGLDRFDKYCFGISASSILVWTLFLSAPIALFINLFADLVGLLPTIRKSYLRPDGEDLIAWTLESTASLINIFALSAIVLTYESFVVWGYPVYLLSINFIITFLIFRPKLKKFSF